MAKATKKTQTTKSAQDLINEWGAKKYPSYAGRKFTFETETRDAGGGCPTCSYQYSVVVVYAGISVAEELRDVAIHDVILDILKQSSFGEKSDE